MMDNASDNIMISRVFIILRIEERTLETRLLNTTQGASSVHECSQNTSITNRKHKATNRIFILPRIAI
jgi:hypothetical protein